MIKKILKKLGLIKDSDDEKKFNENQEEQDLTQGKKKEKDNSNTPDDIYPLW